MSLVSRETQEYVKTTAKESFLILLYESVGTAFMTTLIYNYYAMMSEGNQVFEPSDNEEDPTPIPLFLQYDRKPDNVGLLLGMFVTIMFSARISGSHFNPIITVSYMFGNVRQGKFDRILGFLYIFAQFVGAFLGCIFCKIFTSGKYMEINLNVEGNDML
mmetsp:Transcript_2952/g.5000  ORF Transcript_2952/g.5000 Transcript_2952/m.5000 type:complete len:160 (+) Transcript_2952:24-503(+)